LPSSDLETGKEDLKKEGVKQLKSRRQWLKGWPKKKHQRPSFSGFFGFKCGLGFFVLGFESLNCGLSFFILGFELLNLGL
jgi:hypothetical protein